MLNDDDLFFPIEANSDGLGFELTEVFPPKSIITVLPTPFPDTTAVTMTLTMRAEL